MTDTAIPYILSALVIVWTMISRCELRAMRTRIIELERAIDCISADCDATWQETNNMQAYRETIDNRVCELARLP